MLYGIHCQLHMDLTANTLKSGWIGQVSSPLVLGLDLTNETNMDLFWPIITNHEAIAVNEAWVGDAGTLLKQSTEMARMP